MTSPDHGYKTIRLRVARSSLEETRKPVQRDPARGLRQAQRVIERELNRLPRDDRGPVACRAGCDFCCHLRVMATPAEVFALLDYLESTLDADALAAFRQRVQATDQALRELPADRVLKTNLPCPALVDGCCSGYAGRPLNCRSYHSLSREACEESFNHPEDLERGHPQLTGVAEVHAGGQAGFLAALEQSGLDQRQYELASALCEAIDDPAARQRFRAGERAFVREPVVEPDKLDP